MPETNPNGYIIAAYVITWIALITYTLRLIRTTRRAASRYTEKHNESRRAS
jgi:CcmD family protein